MPEDLLPESTDENIASVASAVAAVTQVDSDADMAGGDPNHDEQALSAHAFSADVFGPSCDSSVQSLLQVSPAGLLDMLPPLVSDVAMCVSLRDHRITWTCPELLLAQQAHVWADDEMLWHVQVTVMHA